MAQYDKVINDCIHGLISLPGYLFDYIDTPQFQRLKNIKQLGGTYYVYPGAAHNRFEHSIGVSYLAGKLARNLQSRLNEDPKTNDTDHKLSGAKMSDSDLKCIEIAALCHDLGHGPMSHLFDQMFYSEMRRKNPEIVRKDWKHEIASTEMFDLLVDENKIDITPDERTFVKDLILGKADEKERARKYMYEIVANERNGIDVDRMDYFARDCHGLGMRSNFDHLRYFLNCKVNVINDGTGETSICVRDKEMFDLIDLFRTRDGLYRRAYKHRVTTAVQFMISDALVSANDHIEVSNSNGEKMTMISSLNDMSAYQKFTDGVLDYILMSDDINLYKAKGIIKRIYKRDLYKCIIETSPVDATTDNTEESDIIAEMLKIPAMNEISENWIVEKVEFKTGFKDVYFYKKNNENTFFKLKLPGTNKDDHVVTAANEKSKIQNIEASLLLPTVLKEKVFRVYSKTNEIEKRKNIKECAIKVLENKGFEINPLFE